MIPSYISPNADDSVGTAREAKAVPFSVKTTGPDAERIALAFQSAALGIALVSRQGLLLEINKAFATLCGYNEAELLAKDFQTLMHPEDRDKDMASIRELLEGSFESYQVEKRYRHRQGFWIWGQLNVSLIPDDQGRAQAFVWQLQDVTARKEAELREALQKLEDANAELTTTSLELQKLAQDDSLTGLKNRRAFDERLHEEVSRSKRTNVGFSVFLLDVDHFKGINDKWGHATGDEVLRQIALLLNKTLRFADTVARYGGEEFALILPGTGSLGGYRAAERCREAIANYAWDYGQVTASCGVATWKGEDEQTLLVRADNALYAAKNEGRNRVRHAQFSTDSP